MFVVMFKQHGALNCEQRVFGPFATYDAAEDALCNGSVPRLYGQGGRQWPAERPTDNGHRYIQELTWVMGAHLDGMALAEGAE